MRRYKKDHPLYSRWNRMRAACYKSWSAEYPRIGARGIGVFWDADEFWEFADWVTENLGPQPFPSANLSRIDQTRDFEPGNLTWSTVKEVGNRQIKNIYVQHRGETRTLKAWAELYNVNYHTFRDRINRGWDFEQALTTGTWEITHRWP